MKVSANKFKTSSVTQLVDSSYDVVKEVHDNLPAIRNIANVVELNQGARGYSGNHTSFIFTVSNVKPSIPVGGTYDGITEVIPVDWFKEPVEVTGLNKLWVSVRSYTNVPDGEFEDKWVSSDWSDPIEFGSKGDKGDTPRLGIDYFVSNGSYSSFIFINSETRPEIPVGGSYNGVDEVTPIGWSNTPVDTVGREITWICKQIYVHSGNSWIGSGWSIPTKFYERGATPVKGEDYFDGEDGESALSVTLVSDQGTTFKNNLGVLKKITALVHDKGELSSADKYNYIWRNGEDVIHISATGDYVSTSPSSGLYPADGTDVNGLNFNYIYVDGSDVPNGLSLNITCEVVDREDI